MWHKLANSPDKEYEKWKFNIYVHNLNEMVQKYLPSRPWTQTTRCIPSGLKALRSLSHWKYGTPDARLGKSLKTE